MLSSTKPCVEDVTTWENVHEQKTTKLRRVISLRSFCHSLPRARVTEVRERLRTGPAHITALPAVRWSRGCRRGGGTAWAAARCWQALSLFARLPLTRRSLSAAAGALATVQPRPACSWGLLPSFSCHCSFWAADVGIVSLLVGVLERAACG